MGMRRILMICRSLWHFSPCVAFLSLSNNGGYAIGRAPNRRDMILHRMWMEPSCSGRPPKAAA